MWLITTKKIHCELIQYNINIEGEIIEENPILIQFASNWKKQVLQAAYSENKQHLDISQQTTDMTMYMIFGKKNIYTSCYFLNT